MQEIFFHIDLDAFYASVEQNNNPKLKGKPVIVGATDIHRGVVSACSYEARQFGVHSAMPAATAHRLCKNGIFLPVNFPLYKDYSEKVMNILKKYTPTVQQISIDEANLDMSGMNFIYKDIYKVAEQIKKEIYETCGLTTSIGIGSNKFISKMASEFNKPNGIYIVENGEEENFILKHKLKDIWGLGKSMLNILNQNHIHTVTDLRKTSLEKLSHCLKPAAANYLYKVVRGEDPKIFSTTRKSKSISNEHTFYDDTSNIEEISNKILEISHFIMYRLFEKNYYSRKINLKIRYSDFTTISTSKTLEKEIETANQLTQIATQMFKEKYNIQKKIRLIGIGLYDVSKTKSTTQQELFESPDKKKQQVEQAVFKLKQKGIKITKASIIDKDSNFKL